MFEGMPRCGVLSNTCTSPYPPVTALASTAAHPENAVHVVPPQRTLFRHSGPPGVRTPQPTPRFQ